MERTAPDRRTHQRVPFRGNVQVIYHDEVFHDCSCMDISEGGMRLGVSLPNYSTVTLLFSMPVISNQGVISIDAAVAWRKLNSTGVRFTDLAPEVRDQLQQYIQLHS